MTDLFTADLHIGHGKVTQIRGFDTIPEHDTAIIDNLAGHTRPGDTLWILGDLTVGREGDEKVALHILQSTLPGRTLRLVTGNHDTCHPMRSKAAQRQQVFQDVFDTVQSVATLKIAGERALLHHFPYHGDHTQGDRYPEWRAPDCGNLIIHGHTHASTPISYSPQGTMQVCVSLDAWNHAPATKEALANLIHKEQQLARQTATQTPPPSH